VKRPPPVPRKWMFKGIKDLSIGVEGSNRGC
jgi:hypothetical protein